MQDIVLQTYNLTKKYQKVVLDQVNLTIYRGDIYGFVGRNGAGKTTLIRILSGLVRKSGGTFELFGVDDDDRQISLARRKMSVMVESASLYPNLTARQNIRAQCILLNQNQDYADELIREVGLEPTDRKKVKDYSLGMRQRLAIAVAMVGEPELLLFDEPTNGLDPEGIVQIRNILNKLNRERNVTMMISSHILGELSKLATKFGFIEKGHMIKEITDNELERECAGGTRFHVSDVRKTIELFGRAGLEVIDARGDHVDVRNATDGLAYAQALKEFGVVVSGFERIAGDLEDYFMDLIGGGNNEKTIIQ
jgi:ABC-2 type transport system ATP-binding protein